jgi:hypothetical protein
MTSRIDEPTGVAHFEWDGHLAALGREHTRREDLRGRICLREVLEA